MSDPAHSQPQRQPIVLIPPTHEQSTPSFHVRSDLLPPFLAFLAENGVNVTQPPESTGQSGPGDASLAEIEIEANTPEERLESLKAQFLERENIPAVDA